MDIAATLVVLNGATRHIIPSFDSKAETRKYLHAYRSRRDLNEKDLGYYQVLGCAVALSAGAYGVSVWNRPPIRKELLNIIHGFSKIDVRIPG
jgi:hypothetical protein